MKDCEKKYYEKLYALIAENSSLYKPAIEAQTAVWEDRIPEKQPLLLWTSFPTNLEGTFPDYHYGEIRENKAKMLIKEMMTALCVALAGAQGVPAVRANMGCGIFPSLFPGIKPQIFDDGKMPWVTEHLDRETIRNLKESDIVLTDEFKLCLEHMVYLAEHIKGCGAYLYPPDLQSPFDVAHLVYGDSIFYDIYDDPGLVHHLLNLSCYAIELGVNEYSKILPEYDNFVAHYSDLIIPRSRGGAKISEDTSTLLSSSQIDEFVTPYLKRVFDHTGGGYVHYCGVNPYLLETVFKIDNAYGYNFGNPEMHDMNEILKTGSLLGKIYYGYIFEYDNEGKVVFHKENESLVDYFRRVRRLTTTDGKCRLLLQYYTSFDEKNSVLDAWAQADDH